MAYSHSHTVDMTVTQVYRLCCGDASSNREIINFLTFSPQLSLIFIQIANLAFNGSATQGHHWQYRDVTKYNVSAQHVHLWRNTKATAETKFTNSLHNVATNTLCPFAHHTHEHLRLQMMRVITQSKNAV
jgi:hypothetical protein